VGDFVKDLVGDGVVRSMTLVFVFVARPGSGYCYALALASRCTAASRRSHAADNAFSDFSSPLHQSRVYHCLNVFSSKPDWIPRLTLLPTKQAEQRY
jgi:hypothetical protein